MALPLEKYACARPGQAHLQAMPAQVSLRWLLTFNQLYHQSSEAAPPRQDGAWIQLERQWQPWNSLVLRSGLGFTPFAMDTTTHTCNFQQRPRRRQFVGPSGAGPADSGKLIAISNCNTRCNNFVISHSLNLAQLISISAVNRAWNLAAARLQRSAPVQVESQSELDSKGEPDPHASRGGAVGRVP